MNRINLICLGVKDMAKSLAFYKEIGFQTLGQEKNPPIVFFDNEGTKLELYPLAELAKDINEVSPPELQTSGFSGITLAINTRSKNEVDELFSKIEAAGGTIAKAPEQNRLWDGYSGYFTDPNGYYWEVAYGKNWQFDDNNMLIID
ncbi:VOC family protein [Enterococcus sp. HY326]|uniref:VOC family protein n=1 Tax=Enterococcus sp. HY326 TaxID=2971265 RepID=UPI00223EF4E0|nr:VOC family protein [Enterococcus sp. HY326]